MELDRLTGNCLRICSLVGSMDGPNGLLVVLDTLPWSTGGLRGSRLCMPQLVWQDAEGDVCGLWPSRRGVPFDRIWQSDACFSSGPSECVCWLELLHQSMSWSWDNDVCNIVRTPSKNYNNRGDPLVGQSLKALLLRSG